MVKVKKLKVCLHYFVILLTLLIVTSCSNKIYKTIDTESTLLPITDSLSPNNILETFITPYREYITKDLDSVLAFNPISQDKSKGKWESNIGNLLANATLQLSNPIFKSRENKPIDFCMLNHGGIRAILPAGNVTTRSAFEIMPFENSVIIIGLTGLEVKELATYMLNEKKPHPLAGITIYTNADFTEIIKIEINGVALADNQMYYVATSDYLANGGDRMTFFKNSTIKYDLDYKLRNLFIDYFKSVDEIPNNTTKHIITE
uniref:5'-nucleotidase C-terminal domain-containing protein n=1 Tax=Flavobacterium sp. TaxID=239 RepID=UPI004048F816